MSNDVDFIENPETWGQDYCCLRHFTDGQKDRNGFLVRGLSPRKYIIFIGYIFDLGQKYQSLSELPQETYNSAKEIIEAGWVVD